MKKQLLESVFTKFLMVVFWVSLIFILLFSSKLYKYFFKEKSINIYGWSRIISPQNIKKFENKTGIKVNLSYYETNEELFAKLKSTKGAGYDLIFPSDNMVLKLKNEKLIKPLEKSKLLFWNNLNGFVLNHYFDPQNEYSIPFYWGVYGIAIDKSFFKHGLPNPSWNIIFNKNCTPGHVGMIDDAREVAAIAAKYLFGDVEGFLNDEQINYLKKMLIQQKKWVEAYTDFRVEDLLITKNSPAIVTSHFEILIASRRNKNIDFIIPEEGAFVIIDNIVIPALSKKDDLTYQFINFLYSEEVLKNNFEKFGLLPPIGDFSQWITEKNKFLSKIVLFNNPENFRKLSFCKDIMSDKKLNNLWIELKAK